MSEINWWGLAADVTVFIHYAYVVAGCTWMCIRDKFPTWLYWFTAVSISISFTGFFSGFGCILTITEKYCIKMAGQAAYNGSFIGHHLGIADIYTYWLNALLGIIIATMFLLVVLRGRREMPEKREDIEI